MQVKKRAKSVKFGKKTEHSEEKKENDQKPQAPEAVKEAVVVKEEVKPEKVVTEPAVISAGASAVEKNVETVRQNQEQVREEVPVQAPLNQGVINETTVTPVTQSVNPPSQDDIEVSPAKTSTEQATGVNESSYVVETEVKKNLIGYFILIAVVSFLIGLISMAGISFLIQKQKISFKLPFNVPFISVKVTEVTPSPKPTITAEPTKETVVDLTEYNIKVLNGSGITGAASKLKTGLTHEGFTVISAGNADNGDYTDTVISAKKNVKQEYLAKLKDYLKKSYALAPDSKTFIPETSEADVIITIGSNSAVKSP